MVEADAHETPGTPRWHVIVGGPWPKRDIVDESRPRRYCILRGHQGWAPAASAASAADSPPR